MLQQQMFIDAKDEIDSVRRPLTQGVLLLEDGTAFEGMSFGYEGDISGEVVFCTGMVGYPEAITDASFAGQILVMTYPLIGDYGVPPQQRWESERVHIAALIVSDYTTMPSHAQNVQTLGAWLREQHVPALEIKDTRLLTQHIRRHGTMLGKIIFDADVSLARTSASSVRTCWFGQHQVNGQLGQNFLVPSLPDEGAWQVRR